MKICTITDQNKREYNQDNKFVIPKVVNGDKVLLAVVADGMGGTKAVKPQEELRSY